MFNLGIGLMCLVSINYIHTTGFDYLLLALGLINLLIGFCDWIDHKHAARVHVAARGYRKR